MSLLLEFRQREPPSSRRTANKQCTVLRHALYSPAFSCCCCRVTCRAVRLHQTVHRQASCNTLSEFSGPAVSPGTKRVRASHYAHPVCALRRFQPATWKLAQCKSVANTSNNMAVTNLARKPSWIASCCSVKQADHRENGALAEKAEEGRAWGQQSIVGHQKGTQAPHCCFAPFEELAAPGPENRCGQSGMPSANQICQPPHLHRIIQDHHE